MQDYVRRRLAGTEPAPAPAQNPAASYVMAQGPARVPPDTMMDSPQFLAGPATGGETDTVINSDRQQSIGDLMQNAEQLNARVQALWKQMEPLDASSPEFKALVPAFHAARDAYMANDALIQQTTLGRHMRETDDRMVQAPANADVMQRAVQDRQNQPRVPLSPPAPGGVPPGAPAVPVTRDLMS
jgi:hypothetical protein